MTCYVIFIKIYASNFALHVVAWLLGAAGNESKPMMLHFLLIFHCFCSVSKYLPSSQEDPYFVAFTFRAFLPFLIISTVLVVAFRVYEPREYMSKRIKDLRWRHAVDVYDVKNQIGLGSIGYSPLHEGGTWLFAHECRLLDYIFVTSNVKHLFIVKTSIQVDRWHGWQSIF